MSCLWHLAKRKTRRTRQCVMFAPCCVSHVGADQLHRRAVSDRRPQQQTERVVLFHLSVSGMWKPVNGETSKLPSCTKSEPSLMNTPVPLSPLTSRTRQSWNCGSAVTPLSQRSSTTWCGMPGNASESSESSKTLTVSLTFAKQVGLGQSLPC